MAEIYVEKVKEAMRKKKYVFFDSNLALNLNIVGIRKDNNTSNHFDDNICEIEHILGNFHDCPIAREWPLILPRTADLQRGQRIATLGLSK